MRQAYDPDVHHRRTVRLPNYDYTRVGAYFVTICTHGRLMLFGEIVDARMRLSSTGKIVDEEWQRTQEVRPNIGLDAYIVMPNHLHGVLLTHGLRGASEAHAVAPKPRQFGDATSGALGAILGAFKAQVTRRVRRLQDYQGYPIWQRGYYERVIRDEAELTRVREYIWNNPLRWDQDHENPAG